MQACPVRYRLRNFCIVASLFLFSGVVRADDPFAENIRKTEPLTPEQEQKAFHLPPGFEIQLVASEPDIGKPMNMAFDARGRLWLTQSREYPFAATNAPYRDKIKILSDFDKSGRARKVTTFAEGLNIPIGILPYGEGAIGFSIPNIYYFRDTNHDGRADTKELLLGRFGFEKDVHGLTSSFRRGFDGWIYADHGFNNDTTLTAKDGSKITMNSGNTYRFRPDGSRVEQFTHGQVNPFGLMFDPLGDLWAADCHSQPVYLLLRGGYYPSFGKPDDGLGFAPSICDHSHGSTAIAGMVYYAATNFPPEFRGNTFVGNVMTSRINRDSYEQHGSTRIAKEEPDFVHCDDPWFRPVDLQLGPDGALYVADFYNRIIGHYEVPLDHPGRDRERGRIWRITYAGQTSGASRSASSQPAKSFDLTRASAKELVEQLANPNITVRMLAMNELVDRVGPAAIRPVEKMLRDGKSSPEQRAHGFWVLHRLNALADDLLKAAAHDSNSLVRVHAMRILAEMASRTGNFPPACGNLALDALNDSDPFVQRAAADALGQLKQDSGKPNLEPITRLLALRGRIPKDDLELLHVCRMALRNQLVAQSAFPHFEAARVDKTESCYIADVALGAPTPEAASFLLQHLERFTESRRNLTNQFRHIARYAPQERLDALAKLAQTKLKDDLDEQYRVFKTVQDGVAQRGTNLTSGLVTWAANLAEKLLAPVDKPKLLWRSLPLEGAAESASPWILQPRPSADVKTNATFISSLPPGGENLTGVLRSIPFELPAKLEFFIAGHDGFPDKPRGNKNFVRVVAADTREVLAVAPAPRNDVAQRVQWDLSAHAGRKGFIEIVDGDTGPAYAWLAAGRFKPAVVPLPDSLPGRLGERQLHAAELARTVPLPQFAEKFEIIFGDTESPLDVRVAAAQMLLALNWHGFLPRIAAELAQPDQPPAVREAIAILLAEQTSPVAREAVLNMINTAPRRLQIKLALGLAKNLPGAKALLAFAETHPFPLDVLADPGVKEKLAAANIPDFKTRYEKLTRNLPPANVEIDKLLTARRQGFATSKTSAERGQAVFEKACIICHQLDGRGAVVGPQLDGIGNRGLERLVEDVLDPSRNIDPAFRPSNVTLKDDTSITGLQRREEGEVIVFVDSLGKEITVPKKEIAERRESQISLMPSNFADALTPDEFYDLMAFLLSHSGAK